MIPTTRENVERQLWDLVAKLEEENRGLKEAHAIAVKWWNRWRDTADDGEKIIMEQGHRLDALNQKLAGLQNVVRNAYELGKAPPFNGDTKLKQVLEILEQALPKEVLTP